MFYVIYLPNARRNVVIPNKWIFNHEKQMNKDMFHGINPNQTVLCYFSPNAYNGNGEPNPDFPPNFAMPADVTDFPNEGCFKAKIKTFRGKCFTQSITYSLKD